MLPESHGHGGVYTFANLISHGKNSRGGKQVGLARTQQLVQIDEPKASSNPVGSAAEHVAETASKELAKRAIAGESAAVSETPDTAEQKAWTWGSSAFSDGNRHRSFDVSQSPLLSSGATVKAAVATRATAHKKLADFAVPARRMQPAARSNESPRRARLAEARHAIVKLHRASLNFEHNHFQHGQRQEFRRAQELTRKDDDLERAANQGAAAEFNEYGAVASLGVPNGANSAAETEGDGWGTTSEHLDQARSDDFRARDPIQRDRQRSRRREHGDEAQDVQQDTDYIFSGLSHGRDRRQGSRTRRGRRGERRGVTQTAAQIASAEESSYQSGFDAGISAEQKAMREGGRESEASHRAEAVNRQHHRLKAQKAAQLVVRFFVCVSILLGCLCVFMWFSVSEYC